MPQHPVGNTFQSGLFLFNPLSHLGGSRRGLEGSVVETLTLQLTHCTSLGLRVKWVGRWGSESGQNGVYYSVWVETIMVVWGDVGNARRSRLWIHICWTCSNGGGIHIVWRLVASTKLAKHSLSLFDRWFCPNFSQAIQWYCCILYSYFSYFLTYSQHPVGSIAWDRSDFLIELWTK